MQEALRISAMMPTPFQIHVERKFDEWVTQDRAFARPGIDERCWITNGEQSDWKDAASSAAVKYAFHGLVVFDDPHTKTLALRCKRKDLPPKDPLFPKTHELRDKHRMRLIIRDIERQMLGRPPDAWHLPCNDRHLRTPPDPVPPTVEQLKTSPTQETLHAAEKERERRHDQKLKKAARLAMQKLKREAKAKPKQKPEPEIEPTPINPLLLPIDMGPPKKPKYEPKNPRKPKPEPKADAQPNPESKIIPAVKICERCRKAGAVKHERFCAKCRKAALAAIRAAGDIPVPGRQYRTREKQENTFETKYGVDY